MPKQSREISTRSDIRTPQTQDSNSRIRSEKTSDENQRIIKARGELSDNERAIRIKEYLDRRDKYSTFFDTMQKMTDYSRKKGTNYIESFKQIFYDNKNKDYVPDFDSDAFLKQKNAITDEYITAAKNGKELQPLKGFASEAVITLIRDRTERTSLSLTNQENIPDNEKCEQDVAKKAISLVQGTEQKTASTGIEANYQPDTSSPNSFDETTRYSITIKDKKGDDNQHGYNFRVAHTNQLTSVERNAPGIHLTHSQLPNLEVYIPNNVINLHGHSYQYAEQITDTLTHYRPNSIQKLSLFQKFGILCNSSYNIRNINEWSAKTIR